MYTWLRTRRCTVLQRMRAHARDLFDKRCRLKYKIALSNSTRANVGKTGHPQTADRDAHMPSESPPATRSNRSLANSGAVQQRLPIGAVTIPRLAKCTTRRAWTKPTILPRKSSRSPTMGPTTGCQRRDRHGAGSPEHQPVAIAGGRAQMADGEDDA